jgi:nucleotide-binding universal stress UspA family protein
MNKISKILAPTDYSDLSCVGLRSALETAREVGAEVTVLHVVAMSDDWFSKHEELNPVRNLIAEQEKVLEKFLRDKFGELMNLVELHQRIELGTAHSNIAAFAEREGIDVIIMSTHGRSGWDHVLLGSVTEKVIAHAPCQVLAIPAHAKGHVPLKAA